MLTFILFFLSAIEQRWSLVDSFVYCGCSWNLIQELLCNSKGIDLYCIIERKRLTCYVVNKNKILKLS